MPTRPSSPVKDEILLGESLELLPAFAPGSFTLVYLDGSHDPAIVWSEIDRLVPRVIPGGFVIVDDTDWFGGEVRRRLDATAPRWGVDLRHNGKQSIVQIPVSAETG